VSNVFIHESAHVSSEADIGEGTKVWINSQIREKAIIGTNCIIGKDTYIDTQVRIGSGVKIQNGVSIYHGVTIEDDVFIGPNAVFTNDYYPRAFSMDWRITPTYIKKGASIGANATVVCGVTIGEYALVGAGSLVKDDVPPHALVVGNPARIVGKVCRCGHRVYEDGLCPSCGERLEPMTEGR
jgi:UDP-2-acetamido-3-amino-2,3-dideoxy-glucuronate N-acetyltransferase